MTDNGIPTGIQGGAWVNEAIGLTGRYKESSLPDPTVTGPCQAQATFMCTGEARGEHLNPLAMLPNSKVPAGYVPMCQSCKDHLSDRYVALVHNEDEAWEANQW